MPSNISDAEILEAHAETLRDQMHTCLPGRVVNYHSDTQCVDVLPLVRRVLFTEDEQPVHEDLPMIPNVPVSWQRGGGCLLVMPLAAGDPVWLIFSEAATGAWQTSGDVSDPQDVRRFGLGYPVAVPGGAPDPLALKDAGTGKLVIGVDGNAAQIRISPDLIELGAAVASFAARADLVDARLSAIQTKFDAHVHPAPGGATSPTATLIGTLASVAAAKVKVQ